MALDQYSYCPCGSGKKIKFCKCADNIQEMAKVERMMEGEQFIAALDKINQLIKTFPSDAWLHALKCTLLLRLREIEQLEEASAKFIRLQPENPLAQLYRAFLALLRRNLEEAATLFWQSVSNTGEVYDPMLLTVALNMVEILSRTGNTLPALLQCEYLLDYLGESEQIEKSYEGILASEYSSVLSRESIPSPSEPENAPWLERFREAYALLTRSRLSQAKTKLEALQREFGPAPEILITLLHCKLLLVDMEGASSLCHKLSESSSLSEAQRAYFMALKFELAPKSTGINVNDEVCQYVLENDAEIETKIISSRELMPINNDGLRQMAMAITKEEVAPKLIFGFAKPLFDERYGESRPRLVGGWIALFGRQTDKPPRLVVSEPSKGLLKDEPVRLRSELGLLNREVLTSFDTPYTSLITTQVALAKGIEPDQRESFDRELKQLAKDAFLDFEFDCLDKKTPRMVANNKDYAIRLTALIVHWEASGGNMLTSKDFRAIYSELGLEEPRVSSKEDTFDLVGGASYFWTDLQDIDAESLIRLMQSAMSRRVAPVYRDYIERSKSMEWPESLKLAAEYTTLNMEVRVAEDPGAAEKILERIYETGKALQLPVGSAVLERIEVLSQLGRKEEAGLFLQKAIKEVPNDPYLLQYLEMLRYEMQQRQMQAAAGGGVDLGNALLRHGAAKSVQGPASGLWTPDGPAPAASSVSEEPSSGSKLWLPGQ